MADGMLALTWNNHSSTFCKTISSLRVQERYTDVTITCESKFYQVHKFVLATCSEYFEKIFQETPCKHPVIVLRDVSCDELEALLNYMYIGSVSVAQNDLSRLIKVAELFKIKGLAVPDDPPAKDSDSEVKITNSDSRERTNSHIRGKGAEGGRGKNSHSDDFSSPNPKRARSHEHASRTSSRNSDGMDDPAMEHGMPFGGVQVKEEVHSIADSESEGQDSRLEASYIAKSEPEDMPVDNQSLIQEESRLVPPYLGSSDSQDVPPDDQSLTQPVQVQQHFTEDLLSLPGPSDAQEWYTEGDASSRGMGEHTSDLHSLESSQEQAQRMARLIEIAQRWDEETKTDETSETSQPWLEGSQKKGKSETAEPWLEGSQKDGRFHCMVCPYRAALRKDLKKHMVVHTGAKPFHCAECSYTTLMEKDLLKHMVVHTGEKPFQCSFCPQKFSTKSNMVRHNLRLHKDKMDPIPSKTEEILSSAEYDV